jgi:hypothetical protein
VMWPHRGPARKAAVLGGFADVVGGCVCDADGDVLCGAALVIGQSQGPLARLGTRV